MTYDYDRMTATRGYFYTSDAAALKSCADFYEIDIPTRNALCPTCDGNGTQALHGMVVSDELLDDLDFMEEYMDGKYDTACEDCKGEKVVKVPDLERLDDEKKKLVEEWLQDNANANAESLAERRAGC